MASSSKKLQKEVDKSVREVRVAFNESFQPPALRAARKLEKEKIKQNSQLRYVSNFVFLTPNFCEDLFTRLTFAESMFFSS